MRIGLDLDRTVYGYPHFFAEFIPAMVARGHQILCTSNHLKIVFENEDRQRLESIGIDPDIIDISLLSTEPRNGKPTVAADPQQKKKMYDTLDLGFDDLAHKIQEQTQTPIFSTPGRLAADYKGGKRYKVPERI